MTQPPIDHHLAYIMEQLDTIRSNQEAIINKQDEIYEIREPIRGLCIGIQTLCNSIKETQKIIGELCLIIKEAQEEEIGKDDIILYKHDRNS